MTYALLIDDETAITSAVASLVAEEGLELEIAATWKEGMDKFLASIPQVVISDFNLPGSEMGLRLLYEVRKLQQGTRLILISAYLNEDDAAKILELDVVDRVVLKSEPMNTARVIMSEVSDAAGRALNPTDWSNFANGALSTRTIDANALTILDSYLKTNRLPVTESKERD